MVQRQVGDYHDYHYQYHHGSNYRINGKVESKLLMYTVYQEPAHPNMIINNNLRAYTSQYNNQQQLKGLHILSALLLTGLVHVLAVSAAICLARCAPLG